MRSYNNLPIEKKLGKRFAQDLEIGLTVPADRSSDASYLRMLQSG